MILTSNQIKAKKLFWEKYFEEYWSKYIFTDELLSKKEKWETENRLQKKKIISAMKPKYKVNEWGGICIERLISTSLLKI